MTKKSSSQETIILKDGYESSVSIIGLTNLM